MMNDRSGLYAVMAQGKLGELEDAKDQQPWLAVGWEAASRQLLSCPSLP